MEGGPGLGRPLVRLQCYEGLDEAKALYEWDYAKQMLHTQLVRDSGAGAVEDVFSKRFLIPRPLLAARALCGARFGNGAPV